MAGIREKKMKQIIGTEKRPIKLWLDDAEGATLSQARNLANLPFTFKHVALMPDAHPGYGMPIGGVLATEDAVIPNAVGVDIGCGMCAVRTSLHSIETEKLKQILGGKQPCKGIRGIIPLGFKHHKTAQDESCMPDISLVKDVQESQVRKHFTDARKQVGTLGGGNHFIEIQHGDDNRIWIMIHSGSRNIGLQIARHYNQLAKKLNARWKSEIPLQWDLAFLPLDSSPARDYLLEMQYCVEFAFANRKHMMQQVQEVFNEHITDISFEPIINIAHNYAAREVHFGKEVVVHRKGATSARKGELGIIPGSQGSSSFIVQGKGNPESFCSCSHGAGRVLGRKQAQKVLDLAEQQKMLDDLGVLHALRGKRGLDEAPGAYKDITRVMENQKDLVDIEVSLTPLAVVKG
jgi:tRNA-splicing ligase RtcB